MSTGRTRLAIWLGAGPEADTEELETLTARLRRGRGSARLKIDGDVLDVIGLSSADQRVLISSWIARHSNG